jgi:hypothetical protein
MVMHEEPYFIDLFAHEGAVRAFDRQRLVVTLGLVSLSL